MQELLKIKIRNASLDLFRKISYSKTTISDIATASGIAKGTLYLYYKNKEEIMSEIMKIKLAELTNEKEDFYFSTDTNIKEKLDTFIICLIDLSVEIKTLLFGPFENLQSKIIKEVFSSYPEYRDEIVSFIIKLMKFENIYPKHLKYEQVTRIIDEFLKFIIGRIIMYVLDTDWNNLEPLKEIMVSVGYDVFSTLIINKTKI